MCNARGVAEDRGTDGALKEQRQGKDRRESDCVTNERHGEKDKVERENAVKSREKKYNRTSMNAFSYKM